MTLDTSAIAEARQRLPERGDVPQEAREALEPPQGPLAGESDHPTGEDILKPDARDTLADVAGHHTVADVADVASELEADHDTAEKALRLHGIEVSDPEGEDANEDTVVLPLCGEVGLEHVRTPVWRDARVLEHLTATCGYSVEDIKTLLERERNEGRPSDKSRWTVRTADIEDALREVGLMEREEPEARTLESEDHRLPKVSHDFSETGDSSPSGGLTVNTADFE